MTQPVSDQIDLSHTFSSRTERMRSSEIRDFLKLVGQPGIISFAGGLPDPALFPAERLQTAAAEIMADPARRNLALQYGPTEGYRPLREWVAEYMTRLGVPCTVENIILTTGSQQAIDLVGRIFVDPGDTIVTTAPSYLGALQSLDVYEPHWATIDLASGDITGNRVPDLAYVVPDFANPSGETMPQEQRERLLDMVHRFDIPLLEDAAYHALRFEGEAVPSLQALDVARTGSIDWSRVIFAGTFSKTIAPGLRTGWVCAAQPIISKLVMARQACDLHGSLLDQMLVYAVAENGYDAQVASLLPVYRHRRDVMQAALLRHMPEGVNWTFPAGGMFFWLTLPETLDSVALVREAIATEGIIFVPGTSFHRDGGGHQNLRLNYTLSDDATIEDGIARLGALFARHLAQSTTIQEADLVGLATGG
ncbi:MAG TPA: PLP-dependent aminotransferase family protein [Thermomicrobiales bacterium]|nr:PLP-dependent aminotransferase family protein [Thermomicrobiales bacterium]